MNLRLGCMPYMLWQNRTTSNFSSAFLVLLLLLILALLSDEKGVRYMLGGLSKQGSGSPVSEVEQSQLSKCVANNWLGSNAAYFLIFRLSQLGSDPSTLLGPGPTSSNETWDRE